MELPRLEPLYQKYREQGFEVVAIEGKRDTARAKKFIEENHLTYNLLENGLGEEDVVRRIFGIGSYPTSFLIGRDGRIYYTHVGFRAGDEKNLEKEILDLLEQSEG